MLSPTSLENYPEFPFHTCKWRIKISTWQGLQRLKQHIVPEGPLKLKRCIGNIRDNQGKEVAKMGGREKLKVILSDLYNGQETKHNENESWGLKQGHGKKL